ncbi:hypothetical protein K461DRAFT_209141, partial [Myriangium duriaei CBS 260.36]
LTITRGAMYDSYTESEAAICLEGTRTEVLSQITAWSDDPSGKRMFWLCGKAGSGKSTIARTIAAALHQRGRLGGSFFFKRGDGDRGNASRFAPTIALQLIDVAPALSHFIASALTNDPLVCERSLQEQFGKLLEHPLRDLEEKGFPSIASLVIVIDALDECETAENVRSLLRLLARLRIRTFVTSRPELPVQLGFTSMQTYLHEDAVLENIQLNTISQDLHKYITHQLE